MTRKERGRQKDTEVAEQLATSPRYNLPPEYDTYGGQRDTTGVSIPRRTIVFFKLRIGRHGLTVVGKAVRIDEGQTRPGRGRQDRAVRLATSI